MDRVKSCKVRRIIASGPVGQDSVGASGQVPSLARRASSFRRFRIIAMAPRRRITGFLTTGILPDSPPPCLLSRGAVRQVRQVNIKNAHLPARTYFCVIDRSSPVPNFPPSQKNPSSRLTCFNSLPPRRIPQVGSPPYSHPPRKESLMFTCLTCLT